MTQKPREKGRRTVYVRSRLSIPRAETRHHVSIPGKLIISGLVPTTINCKIVDLSVGGAKLKLSEEFQLPERMLLFESYKQNIYECHIKWQKQLSVGVSFLDLYSNTARRTLIEDCSLGLLDTEEDGDSDGSDDPADSPEAPLQTEESENHDAPTAPPEPSPQSSD